MCVVLASTKTSARPSRARVLRTPRLALDAWQNAKQSGARSSAPAWSPGSEAEARSRPSKRKGFRYTQQHCDGVGCRAGAWLRAWGDARWTLTAVESESLRQLTRERLRIRQFWSRLPSVGTGRVSADYERNRYGAHADPKFETIQDLLDGLW